MFLPHSDDFQHTLARAFVLAGCKVFPPSVNNLFRGIPFFHEDKIHEHIQESLLQGRRKKKFCLLFSLIFAGFRKGLSAENRLFRRKE